MELESWLENQLEALRERNLFRDIPLSSEMPALRFCSNDYLGLSRRPKLKEAAVSAIQELGVGSTASRLITGTLPVHARLEEALAAWHGVEAGLVFNSGYQAAIGMLPAIARHGAIFSDELNHASLIDGCRLSRAEVFVYNHGDMEHLDILLRKHRDRSPRWIVSESVFSMEGDKAPLAELVRLKDKHGAFLFLDEAHAIGVYGEKGKGLAFEEGLAGRADLRMGTFSKALGSFGGFAVGGKKIIAFLSNTVRSFVFSTSLPPAVVGANLEAVRLVQEMEKERRELREKGRRVRESLAGIGMGVKGEDSPIIPLIVGEAERALRLSDALLREGIWIQAIRPPTVPEGTSRLRITLSVSHTDADYEKLLQGLKKVRTGVS